MIYTNIYILLAQFDRTSSRSALRQALSYIQGFLKGHRKYKIKSYSQKNDYTT